MNHSYSIILPVRNGGTYVKECINSLLNQQFSGVYNIIVLDNCSTDGTTEWIRSLREERIIIHRSKESLTIEQNWGRIRDVAKNEFMTLQVLDISESLEIAPSYKNNLCDNCFRYALFKNNKQQ